MAEIFTLAGPAEGPDAVLLPGVGYTAQAPLLWWSGHALRSLGWRVHSVTWTVDRPAAERPAEFVAAVLDEVTRQRGLPDLVVAKSFGSFAAPWCLRHRVPGVWLTPLLDRDPVADALGRAGADHLAVGGTADPHWSPGRLGAAVTGMALAGFDHSLETADVIESMTRQQEVIGQVMRHANRLRPGPVDRRPG